MSACGNVWGKQGQTDILASQYNKYHQLPGAGMSVNVTSRHDGWEWPPNIPFSSQYIKETINDLSGSAQFPQ